MQDHWNTILLYIVVHHINIIFTQDSFSKLFSVFYLPNLTGIGLLKTINQTWTINCEIYHYSITNDSFHKCYSRFYLNSIGVAIQLAIITVGALQRDPSAAIANPQRNTVTPINLENQVHKWQDLEK